MRGASALDAKRAASNPCPAFLLEESSCEEEACE